MRDTLFPESSRIPFDCSVDLLCVHLHTIYILRLEYFFSTVVGHATESLATLYINYHIIVAYRTNRSAYTIDSSVHDPPSHDCHIPPNELYSTHRSSRRSSNSFINASHSKSFLDSTSRREESARTILLKKKKNLRNLY